MRLVSYTRTTTCFPGTEISPNSITEQNNRIKAYANSHGWHVAEKYSDRKKDPNENSDFLRLLQDGIARKFDAVIVESVFRAGKDLWSAKEVLLQTFHYAGIWFVVVEDDFSSSGKSNEEADAYFRGKYTLLRTETIRYRVNQRNRNGILSWSDVKYGYKMTKDYRLVVDPETAPVVKRMFELCASGMTPKEIADLFCAERIPIPLASRGMNVKIEDPYKWTRLAVRRLLDKPVYIGHWSKVVQGEVVEFDNEPIVDDDTYQKVQDYLKSIATHAKLPRPKHKYNMLVCDRTYGFCIHLRKSRSGETYFTFASTPVGYSGRRHLPEAELEERIRCALNSGKERAERIAAKLSERGKMEKEAIIAELKSAFKKDAAELAEAQREKMEQYKNLQKGLLTKRNYEMAEERFDNLVSEKEKSFQEYSARCERLEIAFSEENPWVVLFLTWNPDAELDYESLHRYINQVVLDNMEIVEIRLAEENWLCELPEEWRV